jgi:glycosyltransferase involved in cell wall biosynthesis
MEPIKITQVATGLITIPPNGWGAVERLIWAYKQSLEKLGSVVDIRYINQVEKTDIVHVHLANLALECKNKGIPYVFSLHDHHTEWYGKDSWVFKQNLAAMKGSIISFTHAEYLIDYFSETDKLFYLPHGADTDFFTPASSVGEHKLLMIANNGLAGDSGFDRKGFRYGIEAARELDLPITIAGHPDNNKFFEIHSELLDYKKLTLKLTNPTDEEMRELYQTHTIFLHPSMLEAGHPNLTLMEATACAVPIVGTYRGSRHMDGMWVIPEITTEAVVKGVEETIKTYVQRRNEMIAARNSRSWDEVGKTLHKYYQYVLKVNEKYSSERTHKLYVDTYNNTKKHA